VIWGSGVVVHLLPFEYADILVCFGISVECFILLSLYLNLTLSVKSDYVSASIYVDTAHLVLPAKSLRCACDGNQRSPAPRPVTQRWKKMAAFDTPLITSLLSPPRTTAPDSNASRHPRPTMPKKDKDANSTIIAQFSPGQQPMGTAPVIPDPTTNLLESTPPQIVRALAQAEPLIRGFNILLGLLTWTSGQDWLSFFLLVAWWISCLYGGIIIKFAGNLLPVVAVGLWYTHHRAGINTSPIYFFEWIWRLRAG